MSLESMAIVLHHSRSSGTAKLVLLGIANHQGDGGAWPSIETLAKYANVTERQVQRAIVTLRGRGEVAVVVQGGGTVDMDDHTRPNRYEVQVACPPWCDRTSNHRDTRRRSGRQVTLPLPVDKGGDTSVTPTANQVGGVTPVSPGGATPVSPEPSMEPGRRQVPASTTDRARLAPPPAGPPAPPPTDELERVRAQLRTASEQHHNRDQRRTTP